MDGLTVLTQSVRSSSNCLSNERPNEPTLYYTFGLRGGRGAAERQAGGWSIVHIEEEETAVSTEYFCYFCARLSILNLTFNSSCEEMDKVSLLEFQEFMTRRVTLYGRLLCCCLWLVRADELGGNYYMTKQTREDNERRRRKR